MIKCLLLCLWFVISACNDTKKIIVHNCSDNTEAHADILRSIDNNKEYLNKNGIDLEIKMHKCGYTMINEKREKFIEGSLTDIELMWELESFFATSE